MDSTTRRRPTVGALVLTLLASLLLAPPPAAADPGAARDPEPLSAQEIVHVRGLADDAVIVEPTRTAATATRIRIGVRIDGEATQLLVRLNGTAVRAVRGGAYLLERTSGLRLGRNRLQVEATVAGRTRPAVADRSFFVGYRARQVLSGGVLTGNGTRPAAVANLRLPRSGVDRITARVNGRPISVPDRVGTGARASWNLGQLGRLRPGSNSVDVTVLMSDGRVGRLRQEFGLSPRRQLVVARLRDDRDGRAQVGRTVVLDLSRSRIAMPGTTTRWTLLRRPLLSRTSLGATSGSGRAATAVLRPDVPGRYLVGVQVGAGATAGYDVLEVSATYPNPLVPFNSITYPNGGTAAAMLLGAQTVPDSGQPLTVYAVNRQLLELTAVKGFANGDWSNLSSYLSSLTDTSFAIVTVNAAAAASGISNLPGLNTALNTIGGTVPPSYGFVDGRCWSASPEKCDADGSHWQLSQWINGSLTVIGVPGMDVGDAWRATSGQRAKADGNLEGWLTLGVADQTQTADQYTFVPGPDSYLPVDTCVGDACAITVGDQTYAPPSGGNGMHVLVLDRTTLKPIVNKTAYSMSDLLAALSGYFSPSIGSRWYTSPTITNDQSLVIMQSLGSGLVTGDVTWVAASVIDQLGGTAETFIRSVDGSNRYALIGAPTNLPFHGSDGLESSTVLTTSGADPGTAAGRLSGVIARDRQMQYTPRSADPIGATNNDLYSILYAPAQAWPDADQTDVLSYIATRLGLAKYPDVRSAYLDPTFADSWGVLLVELDALTCTGESFCGDTFDRVQAELAKEFAWVPLILSYVDDMRAPYVQEGSEPYFDIASVTNQVHQAVPPPSSASADMGFLSIFTDSLFIGDALLGFGEFEAEPFVGLLASSLSMGGDLVQTPTGGPGSHVLSTGAELANQMAIQQTQSEEGFDRLEDILLSDFGRLSTVGTAIQTDPRWDWSNSDTINAITILNASARASAYSALVPLTWVPWALKPGSTESTTNSPSHYACAQGGINGPSSSYHPFGPATSLSQLQVYSAPANAGTVYEVWVLAKLGTWDQFSAAVTVAPDSLLSPIYGPDSTGASGAYGYQPQWWHDTFPIPHYTTCNTSGSLNAQWSFEHSAPKITRPPS